MLDHIDMERDAIPLLSCAVANSKVQLVEHLFKAGFYELKE
jgi:hypothetical protein